MSAEVLRKAAALMRERVSAVRDAHAHCPGEKHGGPDARYSWVFLAGAFAKHAPGDSTDPDLKEIWDADAKHLDPWQNLDVTLAVADLLDTLADRAEGIADSIGSPRVAESVIEGTLVGYPDALLLARAYLGEQP